MVHVLSLSNISGSRYKIGDIITFPEHIDDVRCRCALTSKGQIYLIEVKKNGNYWLFPIHYIRQIDKNLQPIHPVSKELLPYKNDYERVLALLGRKITITGIKKRRMMKLNKNKTLSKRCAIKECYIWDFVD
mgnify:CR=1 FL=1